MTLLELAFPHSNIKFVLALFTYETEFAEDMNCLVTSLGSFKSLF